MDRLRPSRAARAVPTALCLAIALLLLSPGSARAIDFVLVYDDLDENPSWDPSGTQLMAIAEAAAQRWERLIDSPGTHIVDVSWSNLEGSQLGLWKFDPFGNNNLYFDADSTDWFLDATPNEDSEYDFGSPLDLFDGMRGSELVMSDQDSFLYFDQATPPDTLETAYFGTGISGSAANDTDLLSVILHEMGHELGIAGDEFSGRYAIYSFHVNGVQDLEVIEENREGSNFGEEHGHLAPPDALMSPNTAQGVRTLPSATDVLAAARDSGYVEVDLVRKFSGVDGDYDNPFVWIGGQVPNEFDHVSIMHGGTITVDSPETADSLAIGQNSTLAFAPGADLAIDDELWVDEFSNISIPFGSTLSAGSLESELESSITLAGGELAVGGGSLPSSAEIEGRGRLTTDSDLVVAGSIRADGGDLRLSGSALRLDDGDLYALDGNLGMESLFTGASTGEILVGAGHNFTALADLVVPSGVEVRLVGTPEDPSIVNSVGAGVDLTIRNLSVRALNGLNPAGGTILSRTATLQNSVEIDFDSVLTLASPLGTTLFGGLTVSGSGGRLVQDGDISVLGGEVNVAVENFDWGNGVGGDTNAIVINPRSALRIDADTLGGRGNAYRGEIQVNSGVLEIVGLSSGEWSLARGSMSPSGGTVGAGTLAMIDSGETDPTVRGDAFTANDLLVVSGGDAFIESDLTVSSTGDVFVWGNATLFLMGDATFAGGTYGGGGTLVQRGDIDVTADVTMAVDEFNWGNSLGADLHTLAVRSGATLTVDSPGTGDPENRFRGHVLLEGGELVVNTTAGWSLPEGGGFQTGGSLEMVNDGQVPRIAGQDLTIGDDVVVTGGLARIDANAFFTDSSSIMIGAGATLEATGSNLYRGPITGDGTLRHAGSALLGTSPIEASHFAQAGEITALGVGGESLLDTLTLVFETGSETRLFGDLRIRGAATVEDGSSWSGDGSLIVDAGATLGGNASIGVNVVNEGVIAPGESPGLLRIEGDYTQTGRLRIELGGRRPGVDHDVLSILGHAQLGGVLELVLARDYLPAPGEEFEILRFGRQGVSGAFDSFDLPDLGGNGFWDLSTIHVRGSATFVPEPGTFALVAIGLAALRSRRAR